MTTDTKAATFPTIKTVLHFYHFDFDKQGEAKAYDTLRAKLRKTRKPFEVWGHSPTHWDFQKKITALDGKSVTLETQHLFDNQWNAIAPDLRLMDWTDWQYHNKRIRAGYWLEITEEMTTLRQMVQQCGYCGTHYRDPSTAPAFCTKCLDSEYLNEKDLHLLRLVPVAGKWNKRKPLTDAERSVVLPAFVKRQTEGDDSRNVQRLKRQRAAIQEKYESETCQVQTEHDGMLWLMDHGIPIDNVIYYSHTDTFSFGWKSSLGASVVKAMTEKLDGFPFTYQFAKGR